MRRFKKLMAGVCAAACAFSLMATPVYADTDGTELQVTNSSQLEIQLGTAWSGVEFQLRTDVGMYPDTIAVGEDGVLRLEIGGSSTYTLSCLHSETTAPQIGEAVSTETTDPGENEATEPEQAEPMDNTAPETSVPQDTAVEGSSNAEATPAPDKELQDSTQQEKDTLAGIPVMHIVLFGGGLLLAAGGLIAIRVVNRRREAGDDYDDDYYEDDE